MCPYCLPSGGIDKVSGIPGLRNGIEDSYSDIIKATMNKMFDNLGIDRRDAYIYADNMCTRNSENISLLPDRDVVNMLCSHVHETIANKDTVLLWSLPDETATTVPARLRRVPLPTLSFRCPLPDSSLSLSLSLSHTSHQLLPVH
ncbi:hypothetical protein J6590_088755 [Homalodisca vitripennis]|nr:hypothetical protein J6590_088755 [Homalodisca vitripennis]